MGVELMRRAGELTRHGRAPAGSWERLTVLVRRAATELDHRRRSEQRRRRVLRLTLAGVVIGAGTALALTRPGLPHRAAG